jgi:dTDP-4-dehydrorhamnose reductase
MKKRVLILGHTGKMGSALFTVFNRKEYEIVGKNTSNFDAYNFNSVKKIIENFQPDIVFNTVAFLGIDPCEKEPEKAYKLNTLLPKFLSELSKKYGYLFVHFSTDAVFDDEKQGFYNENDPPNPLNLYGITKFGGDRLVQSILDKYYIFRIPVLFGPTLKRNQFVEKMLTRIEKGEKSLRISADIISSPSYSINIAERIRQIISDQLPFGLYHIANEGKASLYDLISEVTIQLKLNVEIIKCSYEDFDYIGKKNTCTPLSSKKIDTLRDWRLAVREYCETIQNKAI